MPYCCRSATFGAADALPDTSVLPLSSMHKIVGHPASEIALALPLMLGAQWRTGWFESWMV